MNASERLIQAAKSSNAREVRKLLQRGALFTKDKFGNTALHEAAWTGNCDIVKVLLKAYCFVDSVNGVGFTPLHLASQNGHAKVAKTLLKWKADPTQKNQHDETALHLVSKYDHAHLVPVFAAAKVNLDMRGKDDNTPLHIAAKLGNYSTVKALLQNGADSTCYNVKGMLPLDYAQLGNYPECVELLAPVTTKSQTYRVNAKRLTPANMEVCNGAAGKSAKSGKVFFRTRSPRDVWAKVNKRKNVTSPENAPNRQSPLLGEAAKKRYSREFEDLPVECLRNCSTPLSFSQRYSQGSRSPSNPSPSLDDMILEIEREAHGPDYQYAPPSDNSEDGESVTYLPMRRVSVGHRSRASTVSASSNLRSSSASIGSLRASLSPSGKEERKKDPIYDFLEPQTKVPLPPPATTTPLAKTENCENGVGEGSYVRLQPSSSTVERRTSPDGEDCVTYSYPVLPDEVLHHRYEYLPPADMSNQEPAEGFDSYIYMAPSVDCEENQPTMNPPLSDMPKRKSDSDFVLNSRPLHEPLRNNSARLVSPSPKKAVICEQPKVLETRHEPNIKMEPTKPILTQFAGEETDLVFTNKLDKYLQEELDTIRQAFQIRLSQLEKRYQRQLASMNQRQFPQQTGSPSSVRASVPNIQTTSSSAKGMHRTASWHGISSMAGNNSYDNEQGASFSTGIDSGSEESLLSCGANSSCSGEQPAKQHLPGKTEDDWPEGKAHQALQERMQEYKVRMMEFLMDRADAKIANMEKQYQQQILELQKQSHNPNPHLVSSNQLAEQPGTFV